MSGLDIEGTLVRHLYVRDDFSWLCACGKWRDKRDDGTGHRAHVAAVLREQIDGALAEAWGEGHRTPWVPDYSGPPCRCSAYSRGECGCGNYGRTKSAPNPYRAAHLSDTERAGGCRMSECRRCGLSKRAATAGVMCDPGYGPAHDFPVCNCSARNPHKGYGADPARCPVHGNPTTTSPPSTSTSEGEL